jgi:hypothetical protein
VPRSTVFSVKRDERVVSGGWERAGRGATKEWPAEHAWVELPAGGRGVDGAGVFLAGGCAGFVGDGCGFFEG